MNLGGKVIQFILGRAGTGKTTKVRKLIAEHTQKEKPCILLVPEQFSFESERALYFSLGAKQNQRVEVLSFTRLCHTLFHHYGIPRRGYIEEGGRQVLLSLAMTDISNELRLYQKSVGKTGFLEKVFAMMEEFKESGFKAEDLISAKEQLDEGSLQEKLQEFTLIYEAYNAVLSRGFSDPKDDMTIASELLREHPYFEGKTIFIDEFKGFTASEQLLMGEILKQADRFTISLCTDSLEDREEGMGLFSGVMKTGQRLLQVAKESGVKVEENILLTDPKRFRKESLKRIEQSLFTGKELPPLESSEGVEVIYARDTYDEMRAVASEIRRLVREENYRYRDIVVIGRNIKAYENVFSTVLPRYEIPYFYSERESAFHKALPAFLMAVEQAALRNFDTESIFRLLKTGILNVDMAQIGLLENYVYTWNIQGAHWQEPFSMNPRGFVEEWTELDQEMLSLINEVREIAVAPVNQFREYPYSMTGLQYAKGLYDILIESGADKRTVLAALSEDQEEPKRIWSVMMETLEAFGHLLENTELSKTRLAELFDLILASIDLGHIPQTVDQVLIGDAFLVRPNEPKAVFIIGCNEGVFPALPEDPALFTSAEREKLRDCGLELENTLEEQIVDEQFVAYKAVSAASEKLYLFCPLSNVKGEPLQPAAFLDTLENLFLHLKKRETGEQSSLQWIENLGSLKSTYALLRQEEALLGSSIEVVLEETEEGLQFLHRLSQSKKQKKYQIHSRELATKLFGEKMHLSPSRVEQYYTCPFSYFLTYGLKLSKPKRAEWSPLVVGSFIHYALQWFLQKYGGEGLLALTEEQIRADVRALLEEYMAQRLGGEEGKTSRFKYLLTRLTTTLTELIARLQAEFRQSEFVPSDFELKVGFDSEVKPVEVDLINGGKVYVEGIIDRVDIMKKGQQSYVRVVDYKTGAKTFKLSDVYYGMNLQMLLYLFAIWEGGQGKYEDVLPAGVLYMPAKAEAVEVDRHVEEDQFLKEKAYKTYQMNGLILNSPEVIYGMEKETEGVFIPVKKGKTGEIAASDALASLAELGKVKQYMETLIGRMAEELQKGSVEALPDQDSTHVACEWCAYQSVCGREDGDPARIRESMKKDETILKMGGEEDGEAVDTGTTNGH